MGQAGYGYQLSLTRSVQNGTITVQYDVFEVGVNADGSVAWQGPHTGGSLASSSGTCCARDLLVSFPGSGEGHKVEVDLQWF
jgi:hypothetical protein